MRILNPRKYSKKNLGHFQAFNGKFFEKHQERLLWLCNKPIIKWWFRYVLRINGKRSSVCNNKITRIRGNFIEWKKYDKTLAEFRTHNKFGKRLYFAFKPLWWALHCWDWLMADRFVLLKRWSFGFTELTSYPDADPETNTVDGQVQRDAYEDFVTLRNGIGTTGVSNNITSGIVYLIAYINDLYNTLTRSIFLFDTSSIGDTDTIDSAIYSFYVTTKSDGLLGQNSDNSKLVLVSSNPATNTDVVAADYSQLGATDFGRSVIQANLTTFAYNNITLNASGLANISKISISKFGIRYGWDFDNTTVGLTWIAWANQNIVVRFAERTGISEDPKLVVQYTASGTTTSTTTTTSSSTTTTTTTTSSSTTTTTSTSSSTTTTSSSTSTTTTTTTTTSSSTTTTSSSTTTTSSSITATSTSTSSTTTTTQTVVPINWIAGRKREYPMQGKKYEG